MVSWVAEEADQGGSMTVGTVVAGAAVVSAIAVRPPPPPSILFRLPPSFFNPPSVTSLRRSTHLLAHTRCVRDVFHLRRTRGTNQGR